MNKIYITTKINKILIKFSQIKLFYLKNYFIINKIILACLAGICLGTACICFYYHYKGVLNVTQITNAFRDYSTDKSVPLHYKKIWKSYIELLHTENLNKTNILLKNDPLLCEAYRIKCVSNPEYWVFLKINAMQVLEEFDKIESSLLYQTVTKTIPVAEQTSVFWYGGFILIAIGCFFGGASYCIKTIF